MSGALTPQLREWLGDKLRYPVLSAINSDGTPEQAVSCFLLDPDRPTDIVVKPLATRSALAPPPGSRVAASLAFEAGYDWVTLSGHLDRLDDLAAADRDQALLTRYGLDAGYARDQMGPTLRIVVEEVVEHH